MRDLPQMPKLYTILRKVAKIIFSKLMQVLSFKQHKTLILNIL